MPGWRVDLGDISLCGGALCTVTWRQVPVTGMVWGVRTTGAWPRVILSPTWGRVAVWGDFRWA